MIFNNSCHEIVIKFQYFEIQDHKMLKLWLSVEQCVTLLLIVLTILVMYIISAHKYESLIRVPPVTLHWRSDDEL